MDKIEPEARYSTREAILAIAEKFNWPYENWMQDWPLEVSGKINLPLALEGYANLTDDDEKFVLMEGILYALDETTGEDFERYSKQVTKLLKENFDIHKAVIYYWTLYDEPEMEDGFTITPLMRDIWTHSKHAEVNKLQP